jgi:hypothetical protein
MPTLFFRAKALWESGRMRDGFELLHRHLADQLDRPVFLEPTHLFASTQPLQFETSVEILLAAARPGETTPLLQAPFARVLSVLWQLDPYQGWLDLLVHYDFGTAAREELELPANDQNDFLALADALAASAKCGVLSSDPSERMFGGRAVLSIGEFSNDKAGPLKTLLQERMPAGFAACPQDFWSRLAADDPQGVTERFLHHLLGRRRYTNLESLWWLIARHHPDYAEAARRALDRVLSSLGPEALTEMVRVDAACPGVADGSRWLRTLRAAMDGGSFAGLVPDAIIY